MAYVVSSKNFIGIYEDRDGAEAYAGSVKPELVLMSEHRNLTEARGFAQELHRTTPWMETNFWKM